MKKLFVLSVVLASLLVVPRLASAQTATLTATVRVNPLQLIVFEVNPPVKEWFDIPVTISNLGTETITRVVATAHGSSKLSLKNKRKKIGNLEHGDTPVIWQAKTSKPGNFFVSIEVSGQLDGEEISASDSITVSAVGSLVARFFRLILGV